VRSLAISGLCRLLCRLEGRGYVPARSLASAVPFGLEGWVSVPARSLASAVPFGLEGRAYAPARSLP